MPALLFVFISLSVLLTECGNRPRPEINEPQNPTGADAGQTFRPGPEINEPQNPTGADAGQTFEQIDVDRARFVPLPARPNAVPVLLFHDICQSVCDETRTYGMTQLQFVRTMLMLQSAGYTTITSADYVRLMRGDASGLPERPVLVTFDDGRVDSYSGADSVLAALGFQATMFIITDRPDSHNSHFMSWPQIVEAQTSKRWDIQLHAHHGHVNIETGVMPDGKPVLHAYYAWLRYDPVAYPDGAHLEPHASWKARTEKDIITGQELLASHVPGYQPITFALPFGDFGQVSSNDAQIASDMRSFLGARYAAWFTQPGPDPDFNTPAQTHESRRYTVRLTTTADSIYDWLARHAHK